MVQFEILGVGRYRTMLEGI